MNRIICLLIACWLCLIAEALFAATSPRFIFCEGDRFAYVIAVDLTNNRGMRQETRIELDGKIDLKVIEVAENGVAKIELTAEGTGKMSGNRALELKGDEPCSILMMVKPDGTIIALTDSEGNKQAFFREADPYNANKQIMLLAVGTYTLFGLNLPQEVPSLKDAWTGNQYLERCKSLETDPNRVELIRLPVEYTFAEKRRYRRQPCLVFTYKISLRNSLPPIPCRVFFDSEKGCVSRVAINSIMPDTKIKVIIEARKPEPLTSVEVKAANSKIE